MVEVSCTSQERIDGRIKMSNNIAISKEKVSIIIPLYNAEAYIERCLHSIVSQSHHNLEVIVVDDASADTSVKLVRKFMSSNPCVRLIQHSTNQGPMLARRDGYEAATGDFIMFVDADDTLPDNSISKLIDIENDTDADIIVGTIEKIYADGHKEYIISELKDNATPQDIIEALLTQKLKNSLCGKLYKIDLFRNDKLQNFEKMTISEDGCLFYQLAKLTNKIVTENEITYCYYENKSSSSHRIYGIRQIENIIVANKLMFDICKGYPDCEAELQYKMSRAIFPLYAERVSNREIRNLLNKYDLTRYGQISYVARFFKFADYWFMVKRFIRVRLLLKK